MGKVDSGYIILDASPDLMAQGLFNANCQLVEEVGFPKLCMFKYLKS